jgi:hypothetical protein
MMEPLVDLAVDEGDKMETKATTMSPVITTKRRMCLLVFKAVISNQRKMIRAGKSHGWEAWLAPLVECHSTQAGESHPS